MMQNTLIEKEKRCMKELIIELLKANIQETELAYKLCKEYNLLNEQETIDWLDKLNAISVR